MNHTRQKYQHGSIRRERRKQGTDVWTLRWRETNPAGSTARRKHIVGTVEEYRTKAAAWKACESLRSTINWETLTPRTVAELVTHYREKEMWRGQQQVILHPQGNTRTISRIGSCLRGVSIPINHENKLLKTGCESCLWHPGNEGEIAEHAFRAVRACDAL